MLTVKLVKHGPHSTDKPTQTQEVCLREVTAVHMRYEEDGRQVLQLGDAPDQTWEVTIGERADTQYSAAFIMNSDGKTVEVMRGY